MDEAFVATLVFPALGVPGEGLPAAGAVEGLVRVRLVALGILEADFEAGVESGFVLEVVGILLEVLAALVPTGREVV